MITTHRLLKPILILLVLSICSKSFFAQDKTDQSIFLEAENSFYQNVNLETDSIASNKGFLKIEKEGFIEWKFDINDIGWYELNFRYRAFGGEKEQYLIKNGNKIPVGFGIAEEWAIFSKDVYFTSGKNTLRLEPSWGHIDIDYLSINPSSVHPSLKPVQNYFYRNYPRDLQIKIENYKKEILSVTIDRTELNYTLNDYPFQENSIILTIGKKELEQIEKRSYELKIKLEEEIELAHTLNVKDEPGEYDFKVIAPYVEHGTAVFFLLPTGKTMLIDCGKSWVRDSILIPFFDRHGIDKIDHFFITHYHGDHDSGDKGQKIIDLYNVENFYDYKSFNTGDEFQLENVNFKILNSFEDGEDENKRSLAIKMEYNGFVYNHGGDTYASNQIKILERFPEDVKADVFYANHHFHGSVDVEYLRATDPSLVIIQAQEAIYARSAYMEKFKVQTEGYLKENNKRYIEDLPTLEVGTVMIRVNSKDDWIYETYYQTPETIIPQLKNK